MSDVMFGMLVGTALLVVGVEAARRLMGAGTQPEKPQPRRGLPTNYREYVEDLYGHRK